MLTTKKKIVPCPVNCTFLTALEIIAYMLIFSECIELGIQLPLPILWLGILMKLYLENQKIEFDDCESRFSNGIKYDYLSIYTLSEPQAKQR